MLISEVMTRDVKLASPTDSLQRARNAEAEDFGGLPGRRERSARRHAERPGHRSTRRPRGSSPTAECTVRDVMSGEVKYVFDDQTVERPRADGHRSKVRRLPVLNRDKRLVGIVRLGDLAQTRGEARRRAEVDLEGASHELTASLRATDSGRCERLVQVGDQDRRVLDSDRDPDHRVRDAEAVAGLLARRNVSWTPGARSRDSVPPRLTASLMTCSASRNRNASASPPRASRRRRWSRHCRTGAGTPRGADRRARGSPGSSLRSPCSSRRRNFATCSALRRRRDACAATASPSSA